MPYIARAGRQWLDSYIDDLIHRLEDGDWVDGEVNYAITRIILAWFNSDKKYATANSIQGVLDCVSKEFYRRHVAPYEDEKIMEHGDVE